MNINLHEAFLGYFKGRYSTISWLLWRQKNANKDVEKYWDQAKGEVAYPYKGKTIIFKASNRADFECVAGAIREIFVDEIYKDLKYQGRVVLDVGSSIGDTAIWFALNGAEKVIGYEIFEPRYRQSIENINANALGDKVDLRMEELKSLNLGLKNAVLKMDIEGGEYPLILGASIEDLKQFDEVIMEYHRGYKDIKAKLESAGFRVDHTLPMFQGRQMEVPTRDKMWVGNLHATRIS